MLYRVETSSGVQYCPTRLEACDLLSRELRALVDRFASDGGNPQEVAQAREETEQFIADRLGEDSDPGPVNLSSDIAGYPFFYSLATVPPVEQ